MIDVPALCIGILLAGKLLVIGEILRALCVGQLIAPPRPRRPLGFEPHVLAGAIVLFVIGPSLTRFAFGNEAGDELSPRRVEGALVGHVLILAGLIPMLIATRRNRLADYGIDWPGVRGALNEIRVGGLGFLASLPPVLLAILLSAPWRTPETRNPLLILLEQTSSDRALIEVVVAAVVTAPLTEELIFRVVLQGLLETRLRPATAIIVPAVLFAAIHGYDAFPILPLALILGIVFHVRRSYVAVVTLHAMFNATFLVLALLQRQLS